MSRNGLPSTIPIRYYGSRAIFTFNGSCDHVIQSISLLNIYILVELVFHKLLLELKFELRPPISALGLIIILRCS